MIGAFLREVMAAARARLESPPEPDTAGGDAADEASPWAGGRYLGAKWSPIHPGRVGGAIRPWATVVHTTDMAPESFGSLLRAWKASAGRGAGAHFLLGRDASQGLHQLADVGVNGNHAGGKPAHGWIAVGGKMLHPNRVTVGIEVHCAGRLILDSAGRWRRWTREAGRTVPTGAPIPAADVEPDPVHKDRGWHLPTPYQLVELEALLRALGECPVMVPAPAASQWRVAPSGPEHMPTWAPSVVIGGRPVLGHVTLDPARKSDPGLVLSRWLAGIADR